MSQDDVEDLLIVERVLALSMRDSRAREYLSRCGLVARDFPTEQHGAVWDAVLGASSRHGTADAAIVESWLSAAMGAAEARDWVRGIVRGGAGRVDDETLALYVERLRQQAGRRRLRALADRVYSEANAERDVAHVVAEATRELESIAAGAATRAPQPARAMADRFVALMNQPDEVRRVSLGIPAVDAACAGGVRLGTVTVVGADTGTGKTTFGQHMLLAAAAQHPTVYFTLETREQPFFDGLVAMHAGVRFRGVREVGSAVVGAAAAIADLPIFVDDAEGQTAEEIAGKIVALAKADGVRVAFVDYVQDIERSTRHARDDLNYVHVSKVLRRCAGRAGVALVELAQVSPPEERQRGKGRAPPPTENDIAWTRQFGKDASYVVMLDRHKHAEGKERHVTRVRLTKNRPDHEHATTWLRYDPAAHRLGPCDDKGEPVEQVTIESSDDEWERIMGGAA